VGINVSAKTIKNKVAPPFRTINFEIHFGIGIKEHEQVFDLLRKHGPETVNGKEVSVGGSGTWKRLQVSDATTGEVLIEKKFYKSDFDKIMSNPEYTSYIDDLLEKTLVKKPADVDVDIDPESYEEVRSVAMEMEENFVDPEE